jgi:hypothetical protein
MAVSLREAQTFDPKMGSPRNEAPLNVKIARDCCIGAQGGAWNIADA